MFHHVSGTPGNVYLLTVHGHLLSHGSKARPTKRSKSGSSPAIRLCGGQGGSARYSAAISPKHHFRTENSRRYLLICSLYLRPYRGSGVGYFAGPMPSRGVASEPRLYSRQHAVNIIRGRCASVPLIKRFAIVGKLHDTRGR